jgi:Domain of unknown function (DUF4153)
MHDSPIESWWQRRLPDISAAAARFPAAVAIAAALTAYKLYRGAMIGDVQVRIMVWLAASFIWVVTVDLYVESQRRSPPIRVLLSLIGIAVLGVLLWLDTAVWLSPWLLLAGVALMLTLAGHLGRRETNETVWLFNHRLWLGALLAGVGAGLLGIGLSAIHETIKLLFGLTVLRNAHEYIWAVSLLLIAPVSFLAFAPQRFADPITAADRQDFTMRAEAALVKFVLVPLLFVYTAILYAYAAKIALAWELPQGTLGSMVVGYLFVGAATLLLGYPSRETGGPLVRLFWRYWVWLAALPVVLLFIAVSRRIADYGLTEQRYLMVLVGIWSLILAGFRIAQGPRFDLRLLTGVLALLLLTASLGPGGAIGLSVLSQKVELASILSGKNILVDGKIVPRGEGAAEHPLGEATTRVRAIEWYLNTHHSLGVLAPWFEGHPDDPFTPGKSPDETVRDLLVALGLQPGLGDASGVVHITHYSDVPAVLAPGKGAFVVGPIVFQDAPSPAAIPTESIDVNGLGLVKLELSDKLLKASLNDGTAVTFDMPQAVTELYARGWPKVTDHRPIELQGSPGGLAGTMIVDNLNGTYEEPDFEISLLRFWLLIGRDE